MNIDACLAAYGLVTALAVPRLLRRRSPFEATPRLAIAAWLLAAVSVLASWLGTGVSLAYHPGKTAQSIGVAMVVGLLVRLVWAGLTTWRTTRSSRMRHVQAAALLGRQDPVTGAVIVDSPTAVAYCLPRAGGGMVVVTTGACDALSEPELNAVLSHERAHLDERHHLIISIGQWLAKAVPVVGLFRELGRQMPRLLEMRADDAAARVHGADTVASAIARLSRPAPAGALGAGGPAATIRALRLTGSVTKPVRAQAALAATAIVVALGPLLATLPNCPHPW